MRSPFRQLARDSAIYGLSTVVQRLLTFLLTPLYTNFLLPDQLGDVAQLYALMAFLTVMATLGVEQAFMRYWVEYRPPEVVLGHAAGAVMAAALLLCGVGMVIAPAVATMMALASADAPRLIQMACGVVFLDAVAAIPFAFLRMQRRAGHFALLRIGSVALNVVLNVLLVAQWKWGVTGVMVAALVSSSVGAIAGFPIVLPNLQWRWDANLLRAMLHFSLPTVPGSIAAMIVQVADRPIVGWFAGSSAVGIYNANYRLAIPMMLAVSVYETAWRPLYLRHATDPNIGALLARAMRYFLAVATMIYAFVTVLIGDIVAIPIGSGHLIGAEYWSGLGVVPIVMAGYIALGLSTTMAASIQISKRTHYVALTHGIAAVVNIALNIALIPLVGYIGAAWATVGAYGAGAIVTAVVAQRVLPVPYPVSSIVTAAILCGVSVLAHAMLPLQGDLLLKAVVVLIVLIGSAAIAQTGKRRVTQ